MAPNQVCGVLVIILILVKRAEYKGKLVFGISNQVDITSLLEYANAAMSTLKESPPMAHNA